MTFKFSDQRLATSNQLFAIRYSLFAIFVAGCAALIPTSATAPLTPTAPPSAHPTLRGLLDVRGAIELHSEHSHDGTTPIAVIARLAQAADLDFIIVTDHNTLAGKAEEQRTGRPLVLVGSELSTEAGHLLALFITQEIPRDQPVEQIVAAVQAQGGLALAAHPLWPKKPWTRWDLPLDGMEIFDLSTALSDDSAGWLALKAAVLPNPWFWRTIVRRPTMVLSRWDRQLAIRPTVGIAGHDTHAHAGIKPFLVDSYASGFRLLATHLLVQDLTPEALAEALRQGRGYVAFDGLADPRPFVYGVRSPAEWARMGDHLRWEEELMALVQIPRRGTITLYRDGEPVGRTEGTEGRWTLKRPGVYRVELFLGAKPWIFSNPIYVDSPPA